MTSRDPTPLRRIAIHVEEPRPGRFDWVLSELPQETEAPWALLRRSGRSVRRYSEAMANGLLALQSLVDDLDNGPREAASAASTPERESATSSASSKGARKKEPAQREAPARAEPPPGKGEAHTAFGFGLIG